MKRPGPPPGVQDKPKKKKVLPLKDRASMKALRFAGTVGIALILAIVLIMMIMPDEESGGRGPGVDRTVVDGPTAEGRLDAAGAGEPGLSEGAENSVRYYRGQGGEPADDPTLTWELTLAISGPSLALLEGRVLERELPGDPPKSDLSFSITGDRCLMTLSESGTVAANIDVSYDPLTTIPFSIDENNQFTIFLTPRKLSLPKGAIPIRFLTDRENSPLLSMQGFIRDDDMVIGTLHSVLGTDIEYVLEPYSAE